jgi:CRP-like cAMP-binding protein
MEETWQLLRRVSIFSDLTPDGLRDLSHRMRVREYPKDSLIVGADDPGDALYVVARGRVKIVLYGESGREVILSIMKSGDFFGEMALLDNQPRSASVIALDDAMVLVLDRENFRRHLAAHPTTSLAILAEMSRRLRRADEVIGNLALLDVYGRVARLLRDLAKREGQSSPDGIVIRERPTQAEIAAMIGTSRETVSRALSDFVRRGLLVVSGRRIVLKHSFDAEERARRAE